MSFLSNLQIDGKEYKVLESSYLLNQPIDRVGKPKGRPEGGKITVTIKSEGKTDLFQWMKESSLAKSGSLTFYKDNAMAILFELKFSNAFCINYTEHFLSTTTKPMTTTITISAQEIDLGGVKFDNLWEL